MTDPPQPRSNSPSNDGYNKQEGTNSNEPTAGNIQE